VKLTTLKIFIHPFSSFPLITREAKIDRPLNAIKKTAPTAAARIRSTSKVCIFKHLLSVLGTALWPANLSASEFGGEISSAERGNEFPPTDVDCQ
jgi:hypothetical protein